MGGEGACSALGRGLPRRGALPQVRGVPLGSLLRPGSGSSTLPAHPGTARGQITAMNKRIQQRHGADESAVPTINRGLRASPRGKPPMAGLFCQNHIVAPLGHGQRSSDCPATPRSLPDTFFAKGKLVYPDQGDHKGLHPSAAPLPPLRGSLVVIVRAGAAGHAGRGPLWSPSSGTRRACPHRTLWSPWPGFDHLARS